jgi:uncharacterized membrane protein
MRFLSDMSGNISGVICAGFALASILAAFSIDAASLYHERRILQASVDLAAISAARDPANARRIARQVLTDAGLWPAEPDEADAAESALSVETGTYRPDPALAPGARFAPGGAGINAVRVGFSRPGQLFFASTWSPLPQLAATGTASATPNAMFSVGSRLARLEGGLGNAVLSALLGGEISLSVMDYEALLGARVGLFEALDALALELGLTAGTYDQLLAASASHGQIVRALGRAAGGRTQSILNGLSLGTTPLPLGRLVDLGELGGLSIGSGKAALDTDIALLDLLTASAALANGSRQVELDLKAGVPGLVGLKVTLTIGEPPVRGAWLAIGDIGTVARTAQLRLTIIANLLGSGLLDIGVRLPIHVELAPAEAQLTALTCPAPSVPNGAATVAARPGLARLAVGDVTGQDLTTVQRARILNALLVKAYARALLPIVAPQPVAVPFSSAEIGAGTVKRVASGVPLTAPMVALLNSMQIDVEIDLLGIGIGTPSSVRGLLVGLITPIGPVLDATVATLLEALGLRLGEADVRVHEVFCTRPVLVG